MVTEYAALYKSLIVCLFVKVLKLINFISGLQHDRTSSEASPNSEDGGTLNIYESKWIFIFTKNPCVVC